MSGISPAVTVRSTWTPVISFDTPGTLAVVYATQWAEYYLVGNLVHAFFNVTTSTFTVGTASGNILISGLPFAAKALTSGVWAGSFSILSGLTKASYTQFHPRIVQNTQIIRISASGSGQTGGNIAVADCAGQQSYQGSLIYPMA